MSSWAAGWQALWDRQQEGYMPDREQRLAALVALVEASVGEQPLVLDLACGTGTVSLRLLERLPAARSIAVDLDPVLLAIASATFADERPVRLVPTDIRKPTWADALPDRPVDAVLTATALHWFPEDELRQVYRDIAGIVRPGGVFANADEMPLRELPTLGSSLEDLARQRREKAWADGVPDWRGWWEAVAGDPALAAALDERQALLADSRSAEFSPPAEWHVAALREAGFAEAGVVWRSGAGAIVAALR